MSSFENLSSHERTATDDAVAFWLMQRDQGVTPNDDPRFVAWLAASPDNLAAWNRAVSLWKDFDDNADPLLEAMRREALTARRSSAPVWKWGAIAAIVAIMLIGGAVGWRIYGPAAPGQVGPVGPVVPPDARPTSVAGADGPATFALPDGSQVTLNAKAAVAVRYDARRRAVRLLRGQAFFRVIHDPARPFTTDAADSVISDVGTDFDVLMRGRALAVTLISGSVAVATGTGRSALQPGERLEVAPGQPDRIAAVDLKEVAAWRTTYIEFHDEPLEKAIAQINRYGGAPARLTDHSIRGIRVSGRFRTGDPTRFARALADILPLRIVSRPDGGVDITKR